MAVKFIVGEYNVIWEALKHYEKHLQQISQTSEDEDEEILADDKLMKLEGIFKDLQDSALRDWGLELK
jgi:hypothetical protein